MRIIVAVVVFASILVPSSCSITCTCYGVVYDGSSRHISFQRENVKMKDCGKLSTDGCSIMCRTVWRFRTDDGDLKSRIYKKTADTFGDFLCSGLASVYNATVKIESNLPECGSSFLDTRLKVKGPLCCSSNKHVDC